MTDQALWRYTTSIKAVKARTDPARNIVQGHLILCLSLLLLSASDAITTEEVKADLLAERSKGSNCRKRCPSEPAAQADETAVFLAAAAAELLPEENDALPLMLTGRLRDVLPGIGVHRMLVCLCTCCLQGGVNCTELCNQPRICKTNKH